MSNDPAIHPVPAPPRGPVTREGIERLRANGASEEFLAVAEEAMRRQNDSPGERRYRRRMRRLLMWFSVALAVLAAYVTLALVGVSELLLLPLLLIAMFATYKMVRV